MKRMLSFFLCLVLCISLLGCGETAQSPETTAAPLPPLQVGYGRTDISPGEGIPLRGYGDTMSRLSDGNVTERLYTTCIAFTDETGKTVLLFHMDLCNSNEKVFDPIREEIAAETGIPFEQILVTATHTHSAPDIGNIGAASYTKQLNGWMMDAAKAALDDRKEAGIQMAEAYPEDLNWIRYYNYSDGTWGSGTLPGGAHRVSHTRDTDNQLQMLRFVREDAKDVFLVNWQGHPHRDGAKDKLNATSDIVGAMRRVLEDKDDDVLFAYFTGASGNVNNHSLIVGVTTTADYFEHGKALVEYMVTAEFTPVQTAPIQLLYRIELVTSDSDQSHQYDFPLCAFSIGEVAFVTAPYEMFDTSGMVIKEGSPFKSTFVATCANASCGYLPTRDAFDAYDSYEVGVTKVIKGSAEHMEEVFAEMLGEIYNNGNP